MQIELNEIKNIRKKFGLSQTQLAKRAGVSQSLVAKIESGRIDPTYSKAQKIFDALQSLTEKKEVKAEDLMNKNIISAQPEDTIKDIIKKMKKHGISQMPVVEEHKAVGTISETTLLDAITSDMKPETEVREVMKDAPPIVAKNATLAVISNLLRYYPMILVSEEGKLKGLITKSDMLSKVYG